MCHCSLKSFWQVQICPIAKTNTSTVTDIFTATAHLKYLNVLVFSVGVSLRSDNLV